MPDASIASALPADCDVTTFGAATAPLIEICVPTHRDDPLALIAALGLLEGADECALTVYDDGSGDEPLRERTARALAGFPGAGRHVVARDNVGRSRARNRLVSVARSDWVLLLDADMLPDLPRFLARYMKAVKDNDTPRLIAGGFSLDQSMRRPDTALHAAQSLHSECVWAKTRRTEPGRYTFTSNILVHRTIVEDIALDDGFNGWGWEDVDWGLRVAEAFDIEHIDNRASHLGLDKDAVLLDKYAGSGANFARIVARHPEAVKTMALYRAAKTLKSLPGRAIIASVARRVCTTWPKHTPIGLRLFALKLYRAAIYAEALR